MQFCPAGRIYGSGPALDVRNGDPDTLAFAPRDSAANAALREIRARRHRTMLIAVAAFASSFAAIAFAADDSSTPASAETNDHPAAGSEINQILEWMRDANVHALLDRYQNATDPVVHVWATMAIERTHFNLDAASRDAQLCEKTLSASQPAVALLCGEFEAGDLRLAGKWQAARDREAELAQKYRDRRIDARIATLQKYLDREGAGAPTELAAPAQQTTISLRTDEARPSFDAKANGHPLKLMLDTGATDLVLGEQLAREIGVTAIDQRGHARGWLSKDVPVQRGVLDMLQVGDIVWRNVSVRIVPRRVALLGANLVAPLGTLLVTRKSIAVYAADAAPPACTEPMEVGSDLHGRNLRILPSLQVNDSMQTVLLDTGSSHFLLGTKAALDEVTRLERKTISMGDIGGRHPFVGAETAKIRMTISGQPFRIYFTVLTESDARHAIALGADALRDMDFLLDFRHQHLCFPMHAKPD